MSPPASESVPVRRLDVDVVCAWLREAVNWPDGVELRGVRVNRLWAGRRGRVTFELSLTFHHHPEEFSRTLQGGLGDLGRPAPPRIDAKFVAHGLAGLRLVHEELGLWCCTPDRDRKLSIARKLLWHEDLTALLRPTQAALRLRLNDDPDGRLDCEMLAYRAGKRCVVRVRSRDPQAETVFLKAFRRPPRIERIETIQRLADALARESDGRVRIPEILDFLPEPGVLMSAGAPRDATRLSSKPEEVATAAKVLVALHGLAPAGHLPEHTPADELATVSGWIGVLPIVGVSDCAPLSRIVQQLSSHVATMSREGRTLLHRDYYPAQLLRSSGAVWLTDLDTLSTGHPEQDVATYAAHVILDELQRGSSVGQANRLAATFVDAYQSGGGCVDSRRMGFYWPCALARLGAIRLGRDEDGRIGRQLWDLVGSGTLTKEISCAGLC